MGGIMTHNIAIIGGGAASIVLLRSLARDLPNKSKISIHIFEKGKKIGPGLPYKFRTSDYILNLPTDFMSTDTDDPDKFKAWLKKNGGPYKNDLFPPRYLYGDFLESEYWDIKRKAREKNIFVHLHLRKEVTNIRKMGGYYSLVIGSGVVRTYDAVILATGHLPTSLYAELKGCDGYFHSPWSDDISNLKEASSVVLIGTRLTAIDTALELSAKGYKGIIHMVSRGGLLPKVLGPTEPYTCKFLTIEYLNKITQSGLVKLSYEKLVELLFLEISHAEGKTISLNSISSYKPDPIKWLSDDIKAVELGSRPWQNVLFSIYPIVPTIWNFLTNDAKEDFLKNGNSLWLTYLAAFPVENAKKILSLLNSGKLQVHGGLTDIKLDRNKDFRVSFTSSTQIISQIVINCTGSGNEASIVPLYSKMESEGLLGFSPFAGIKCRFPSQMVISKAGNPNYGLHAIGDPTKGDYLATSDLTQIRAQANAISCQISSAIAHRSRAFDSWPESVNSLVQSFGIEAV